MHIMLGLPILRFHNMLVGEVFGINYINIWEEHFNGN